MSWVAISSGYLFLLLFPFMMISKMVGDVQHERIEKKIEAEGIDLMKSYEELTGDEYWKIRNAVIKHYPQFKDVNPSPPYEISSKEDQIITTIQGLLQRSLIQDLSLTGNFDPCYLDRIFPCPIPDQEPVYLFLNPVVICFPFLNCRLLFLWILIFLQQLFLLTQEIHHPAQNAGQ